MDGNSPPGTLPLPPVFMQLPRLLVLFLFALVAARLTASAAAPVVLPTADARRLEVLFLGAPTANGPGHDPISRYRILKKALGVTGINLTYSESLEEALQPDFLRQFDAVLLYGNWPRLGSAQEKALFDYIAEGRGFLPIHCASACFGHANEFIKLVGARFQRHGGEVFTPVNVAPDHPILQGVGPLEAWDETYVHDRHNADRTVLQVRRDAQGDEPWTWVRSHGKGRVFYTASGHDHRVWDLPEFHSLLRNAIYWSVGDAALAKLTKLQLPALPQQEVLMPGYKLRKAITQAQVPLSPADSAKLIQVPLGFEVALFASEPDIVNPIHVAWDHRGRAFVIETIDYPNNLQDGNLGNDRIKICEDTDGDGRADKFTVFADKLSIPTSLTFVNGGVIATNGTELIFLQDTDGDDVADVRQPLITGFSMRDTHAGPSNLRYGFDNWIYATIGYSGFEGVVGGQPAKFTQGLFRFKSDGSQIEYLQPTTNNTWGLGFTEEFSILGSTANGNPSWVFTLPRERYEALGLNQPRTPRADDNPYFYPSSMDIRQVDVHDKYTSGAGHAFYTARRFPADYQNRAAFVTEPTGKLIGTFDVAPAGASFTARQRPNNIFNSADAWTSPVAAEVGPDGALWVADWYNLIIQHNPTPNVASSGVDAENGKGNAYQTPLRDKGHGRIWRVYPQGSANEAAQRLDPANADTLVAALSHTNLLWAPARPAPPRRRRPPRGRPRLARAARPGPARGDPRLPYARRPRPDRRPDGASRPRLARVRHPARGLRDRRSFLPGSPAPALPQRHLRVSARRRRPGVAGTAGGGFPPAGLARDRPAPVPDCRDARGAFPRRSLARGRLAARRPRARRGRDRRRLRRQPPAGEARPVTRRPDRAAHRVGRGPQPGATGCRARRRRPARQRLRPLHHLQPRHGARPGRGPGAEIPSRRRGPPPRRPGLQQHLRRLPRDRRQGRA